MSATFHLDETEIPEWTSLDFGIRLRDRTPAEFAELLDVLARKLQSNAIRYDLNVRNYAHLRDPQAGVPRILVLCVLASR